jgi:hypothetical protein
MMTNRYAGAEVWAEKSKASMLYTAEKQPAVFFATCARLLPNDVRVTVEQSRQGSAPGLCPAFPRKRKAGDYSVRRRNCMPAVAESLIGSWTLVAFEFEFEDGQRQAAYDDGKGSRSSLPTAGSSRSWPTTHVQKTTSRVFYSTARWLTPDDIGCRARILSLLM